jgi:uncharacterized membrane protein SpoIIM required for sporulation
MVLERLISLRAAAQSPFSMFVVGAVVAMACLVISFVVFSDQVGMFTTFLVTMAMTPFMVRMIYREEKDTEDEIVEHKENFLTSHADVLQIYAAFFCGVVLAMSIVFIMLPDKYVEPIFKDQVNQIKIIRGGFADLPVFSRILLNNLSVLMISFLFSFLFGSGAIFILTWNASVLSAAIGMAAKTIGGVAGFPVAVMMFFPHGSLEILAYLVGGVGGGLISVAITSRHSKCFWDVCGDSMKLMFAAVVLLVVAAFVESMSL